MGPQPNPTTIIIIIIMATTQQQQQGTGTGMKKLAEKPTLLGEKQQDKLKIHGGPFLSSRLAPLPTRPTWTNWTGGCAASRPRALTNGLCLPRTTWASASTG